MKDKKDAMRELYELKKLMSQEENSTKVSYMPPNVIRPEDLQDAMASKLADALRQEVDDRLVRDLAFIASRDKKLADMEAMLKGMAPAVPATPPIPKMNFEEMSDMLSYMLNSGLISEEHVCWMIIRNKAVFYKIEKPTDKMREALSMAEL